MANITIYSTEATIVPTKIIAKTQKGKSILYGCDPLKRWLDCSGVRGAVTHFNGSYPTLIQSQKDIDKFVFIKGKNVFARPCPKTPRHGFVDSRIVTTKKQISSLLSKVLRADPEGELILTNFINDAKYNAVLSTSGLLSIGPGHDGATAGKKSFSLPVKPEVIDDGKFTEIVNDSGLPTSSNLFIESVFTKFSKEKTYNMFTDSGLHITQVRGGPSVKAVTDFIPKAITVTKIVKPNDDLLAWEKEVKTFAPGTVVYGVGHTLASHAAIHCVINNIPFITSFVPKVGQKLNPSLSKKTRFDHRKFRLGTTLGFAKREDITHMFHLSVTVLHNWAYLRHSEHAPWLLGLSAAYLSRVLCALNYGEYRHFINQKHISRNYIYKKVINSTKIGTFMKRAPEIASTFLDTESHAYGGERWRKAVKANVDIWNSITRIHKYGSSEIRINKLISLMNKSINLIHNNGWLFNKISSKHYLSSINKHSGLAALQLADIFYKAHNDIRKIKRLRNISSVRITK